MADANPQPAPPASPYLADALYDVGLARAAEWPKGSGIVHSPRKNPHLMTGAVLQEIPADAVASVKPH